MGSKEGCKDLYTACTRPRWHKFSGRFFLMVKYLESWQEKRVFDSYLDLVRHVTILLTSDMLHATS